MSSSLVANLFHGAIIAAIEVASPLLAILTVVAIVFGVLQAATQVQDSSVSFTPKLVAAIGVAWFGSSWMASILTGFMQRALSAIPAMVLR